MDSIWQCKDYDSGGNDNDNDALAIASTEALIMSNLVFAVMMLATLLASKFAFKKWGKDLKQCNSTNDRWVLMDHGCTHRYLDT